MSSEPTNSGSDDSSGPAAVQVAAYYTHLKTLTPRVFVTQGLVVVNIGVFVTMLLNGVDWMSPSIEHLLAWGANFAPRTTNGEWWRLLMSNYIHIGIMHIAFNMWVLWDVGRLVERLVGNAGFVVMYVLSGVFGSVASTLWNPLAVSAGASGAVFGVFGCLIAFLWLGHDAIPRPVLQRLRGGALVFVAFNVLYSISQQGIDMAAHFGGLATGFVFGAAIQTPAGSSSIRWRGVRIGILGAVGAGVLAIGIGRGTGHVADLEAALNRLGDVERNVVDRFNDVIEQAEAGVLSDERAASMIDLEILSPWREAREAFEALDDVTARQRPIFDRFVLYMNVREEAWQLLLEAVSSTDGEAKMDAYLEKMEDVERIIAEINEGE